MMLTSRMVFLPGLATFLIADRRKVLLPSFNSRNNKNNWRKKYFSTTTVSVYSLFAMFRAITIFKRENKNMNTHQQICENKEVNKTMAATSSDTLSHADWLNQHKSAEEEFDYVKLQNFNNSQDPELLWRFGRACHYIYTHSTATKEVKEGAIRDGLKVLERAVQLEPQNTNALVWLGRVTGNAAEQCGYSSPRHSCQMALKCREYFKDAIELKPDNHEAWFSLGLWSYNVLTLPFYQRIIVCQAAGFTPDMDEVIDTLKKSNELTPLPITSLYIAKCYLYTNKKDKAKEWLESAANFEPSQTKGADQVCSKREAIQLLRKL